MNVTLIGLGTMGAGMANQLLSAGYRLTVFNRNSDRAKPFVASGAVLAANPRESAEKAEIVISMVADDAASRSVWLGANGALAGAKPGTLLIESSTLSPGWVTELAAEATKQQCDFLDAPVTGSKPQAAAGQLVFMVGGDPGVLDRARPVLQVMSREIRHFGPLGSGAKVKLLNNLLIGIQVASFAEMLALAERIGVDAQSVANFVSNGAPGSPIVKTALQRISTGDFTPNFSVQLMAKDLAYASAEGESVSIPTPLTDAAKRVFETGIAEGFGAKDICSVIEVLRNCPIGD